MIWLLACGPNPPTVELGPEGATSENGISVFLSDIDVDEFGDPVEHTYDWFLDGEPFTDDLGDSVAVGYTEKGQEWEVVVTAVGGRSSNSAALKIRNALPSVSIYLAESSPADVDVEAYLYEDDPDEGDTVTLDITWLVDDADSGERDAVLPASATSSGETWTLVVVPGDGDDDGEPVSASVRID